MSNTTNTTNTPPHWILAFPAFARTGMTIGSWGSGVICICLCACILFTSHPPSFRANVRVVPKTSAAKAVVFEKKGVNDPGKSETAII